MQKTMMIEMHPVDYNNLKKAAEMLGYSETQLMQLSSHLIAGAVLSGKDTIQAPPASRNSARST